ncbi:MAG TPA: site-2 protease family protein [Gammaproteobacteria bacterium]|nr:site-2 protease family protein [Gammaproteobacteria bacterium]
METSLNPVQLLAVAAIPLLFAITVHEVAHGWVARRLGDPTALMMGRLTLNPIKHIDPIGTVVVPVFLLMAGGFIFGWAKPVPVTWENLRNPKRDMALVSAAGPLSNLVMAVFWALVAKFALTVGLQAPWAAQPLILMGELGIIFNLILMVLNLLPIPPLDGSRVVSSILPPRWAYLYGRIEPYGVVVIILLLATGLLAGMIGPPISYLERTLYSLFGL